MKIFPLDLTTNTDKLKKLISEHPTFPIVVIVGEEAYDEEFCWTYCRNVRFEIEEILDCAVPYSERVETDRDNFDNYMEDWLYSKMEGTLKGSTLSETEFEDALKEEKAKYEPYWKKVIAIYVG